MPDQWSVQNNRSGGSEHRTIPTADFDSYEPPSERNGSTTTNRTSICGPVNNATTPPYGRERMGWMNTDGGISPEDGRLPYGFPGDFGEELGESKGIRPSTMVSAARGDNRDFAVDRHNQILFKTLRDRPLILYTDGSGIEGKVGAAVVVNLEDHIAHSQLGDDDTSTVYAAELRVIERGLALVLNSTEPWTAQAKNGQVIFVDSQVALEALHRPSIPSG